MRLDSIRNVHCIGIGGIGVSALARLFHDLGKRVSGSDLAASIVTDDLAKRGLAVRVGPHRPENIPANVGLVVYSAAVPEDNPERREAARRGLTAWSYFEALGQVMAGKETITISGTHGKTTVTAMIGSIFVDAGLDPTVVVGSRLGLFDGNERLGHSNYFIAEACEWRRHFLHLPSRAIVLTNIEADHLDYFKNLDDIVDAFAAYVRKLPPEGLLVVNAEDPRVKRVAALAPCRVLTFGLNRGDRRATAIEYKPGQVRWRFEGGDDQFPVKLRVPGEHNIRNALAAATLARAYGVTTSVIQQSLARYPGAWRRFEQKGTVNGAIVIDDYAHHPTEINATIQAARSFFPGRRLLVAFQPHHRNRTVKLFDGFVDSLSKADELFLTEIYDVAGRELGEKISGADLARALRERGKRVRFDPTLPVLISALRETAVPNDVILIMGAGTITDVAGKLVDKQKSPD